MASSPQGEITRARAAVPKVEGLPLDTAVLVLRNAGFMSWRQRFVEAYAADGQVVRQVPTHGILADTSREITLHVAQRSWLDYLPTAFRQSASEDGGFVRNFLYLIQHLHTQVTHRVDRMHEAFHPLTTDPDLISWLASWVGLVMAPEWDERTRRKWVHEAPKLYARRGTRSCLQRLMKIFTGLDVEIVENRWPYKGFRVGVSGHIGVDSVIMAPVRRAHSFVVRLPVRYEDLEDRDVLRIHQVIQMEKPAHTTYFVEFKKKSEEDGMQAFMQIGAMAIGLGAAPGKDSAPDDDAQGEKK